MFSIGKIILIIGIVCYLPVSLLNCGSGWYTKIDYNGDQVCDRCHSTCKQCTGDDSQNHCTECQPQRYLATTPRGKCQSCHSSCQTCSNNSEINCGSCRSSYTSITYTYNSISQTHCLRSTCVNNKKYYSGGSCVPCDDSCEVCISNGNNDCLKCADGYYQSSRMTCLACNTACTTCSNSGASNCLNCNIGYYNTSTSCSACHRACATCSSPSILDCATCRNNFSPETYQYNTDTYSICKSSICSNNKYSNDVNGGNCNNCNGVCATCFDSGPSSCLSCSDGYYESSVFTCFFCHVSCSKCTSPSNGYCTQCKANYNLVDYSYASTNYKYCLASDCLTNQYRSGSNCIDCDASCLTCYGGSSTQCLTCAPRFYQSGLTTCTICNSPCLNCYGSLNGNCSLCRQDLGVSLTLHVYSFNSTDYGFCEICADPAYYWNGAVCQLCHASCFKCYGSTNLDCMGCKDQYFEQRFSECTSCSAPCKKCTGNLNGNCTSCLSTIPLKIYQYQSKNYGFCSNSLCSTTQYFSGTICQNCHPACLTCYGSTNSHCLQCKPQYYATIFTTCMPCYPGCSICPNDLNGNCTACNINFYNMVNYSFDGRIFGYCVATSCNGNKKYRVSGSGASIQCNSCNAACQTCYGPLHTNCLSCASGYYRTDYTTCSPCYLGCATCTDNTNDKCQTCISTYFKAVHTYNFISTNYCVVTTCYNSPNKLYQTATAQPCLNCDPSCWKCYGPTNQNCILCDDHYYLTAQTTCSPCHTQCLRCSGNNNNQCTKCVDQYYLAIVASSSGTCEHCQPPCVKCFGIDQDSCFSCVAGKNLEVKNNNKNSGVCKQCPAQCTTCKILSYPNICLGCIPKYFFTQTNSSLLTGHCKACHYTCAQCSGLEQNKCIQCNTTSQRSLRSNGECICGPWFMNNKTHDDQECVDLVCDWGTGESVNSTGYCSVVCGDGLVGDGEECDDHNSTENGCSSTCTVEQYYMCVNGSKIQVSFCFYATPIGLTITKVLKDPLSNSFTIWLKTNFTQTFMDFIDFNRMIVLEFQFLSASFTYSDGVIVGHIEYLQNLHLQVSDFHNMEVNIARVNSTYSFIDPYNISYKLQSDNNLALNYYPPQVYSQVGVIDLISKVIAFSGLIVCAIGLVRGKVVSTELVLNLQLSYFGLAIVRYSDPLFYSMSSLKYVNGYNIDIPSQTSETTQLPLSLINMDVLPQLISNINVMLVPFLLLGFVGFAMLMLEKMGLKWASSRGFINRRKQFLGQYLLISMMFICFPVSFYTASMIRYFPPLGIDTYIGLGISGLFLAGMVCMIVSFKKNDHWHFGQFKSFFKQTDFCQFYFAIHIIQRVVLGLIFGAFGVSFISNIVLSVILIGHSIFVIVVKPYSLIEQNIRCSVGLSLPVLVSLIYTVVGVTSPSLTGGGFRLISPYLILFLTFSSLCVSGFFIYRQIKMMIQVIIDSRGNKKAVQQSALKNIQKSFQQELLKKLNQNGQKPIIDVLKIHTGRKRKLKKAKIISNTIESNSDYNTDILKQKILHFKKYEADWFRSNGATDQHLEEFFHNQREQKEQNMQEAFDDGI